MKRMPILTILCGIIVISGALIAHQYVPDWRKKLSQNDKNDEKNSIYYGPTHLSNQKAKNLTIYGPAELKGMNVADKTVIKGPVEAKNSNFQEMQIDGIANFEGVKAAKLNISGPLYANKNHLTEASVASTEAAFSQSKVNKLIMKKEPSNDRPQQVYLEKGTKIDTLIFESQNGKVILVDSNSSVTNLEGGSIEQKK